MFKTFQIYPQTSTMTFCLKSNNMFTDYHSGEVFCNILAADIGTKEMLDYVKNNVQLLSNNAEIASNLDFCHPIQ